MRSNGEDLRSNTKMSEDSNNDKDGSSGGDVRDKRGVNRRTSTSSGRTLTLASGDGNTSRGAVTIDGGKPFKGGNVPSTGEDLSGNNEMSKDSNDDDNGSSSGGVRDRRGDNCRTLTSSGRSLTLASDDGNTSGGTVTINDASRLRIGRC